MYTPSLTSYFSIISVNYHNCAKKVTRKNSLFYPMYIHFFGGISSFYPTPKNKGIYIFKWFFLPKFQNGKEVLKVISFNFL